MWKQKKKHLWKLLPAGDGKFLKETKHGEDDDGRLSGFH